MSLFHIYIRAKRRNHANHSVKENILFEIGVQRYNFLFSLPNIIVQIFNFWKKITYSSDYL